MSVLDCFRLNGRRALITGGSRGLGLEMARALGEAGAEMVIGGSSETSLQNACETLRGEGVRTSAIQEDLSPPEEAERLCEVVLRDDQAIDILIDNVGGGSSIRRRRIWRWKTGTARWMRGDQPATANLPFDRPVKSVES